MAEITTEVTINLADLDVVKEKVALMQKRLRAYEEGLECLEAYLGQFPNSTLIQQMIKIWFADARQEAE